MYDIFFLSYDEPMADRHWDALAAQLPAARRIHGIRGIHAAHRHCASLSRTSHFFVVDADNQILDYNFDYRIPPYDAQYVHLWFARNPLNGLTYGWGGVKLFPKKTVLSMPTDSLDMTTSFPLKIVPEVKSVTHFNYGGLETWRAAFREAVKLSLSASQDSVERLNIWKNVANGPFAGECIRGARDGAAYAEACHGDNEAVRKINDFDWLNNRFET